MTKVMLAEDDLTMLSLLKTLLTMEGFQVIALDADADVSGAVRREQPDILLLDIHLRGQSGFDVLDQLRASEDTRGVRVVAVSGLNLADECRARGADDFLLKPFMPDDLLAMLKRNTEQPG